MKLSHNILLLSRSWCEFERLKDRQIDLQIPNGVRDRKLMEQLWEDDLSLDTVIKKCHLYEQLFDTRKRLSSTVTEYKSMHQISKQQEYRNRRGGSQQQLRVSWSTQQP